MLTFGAGSSCDVCFERFGQDSKAPCSIPCGHVFCHGCLSHITTQSQSPSCPLCRKPFDPRASIKLHVDLDAIPPEQTAGCQPDEIKQAQRLHASIARIADVGIEEQDLRQLIQDTRNFLHGKPRHSFHDLRVAHRMIAYMCELKSDLRKQRSSNESLNDQIKSLREEKEDLLRKLQQSEQDRVYERETALAVEKSLREHNSLAVRNYRVLIEVYNKLAQSTAELLKNAPLSSVPENPATSAGSVTRKAVALPPLDMSALEGVAVRDSESSFLISPLPQFTHALPSVLGGMAPLPELTEDIDGEEREEEDDEEEEVNTPDSARNDRPIEEEQEYRHQSVESIPTEQADHFTSMKLLSLSRTGPYNRSRSQSIPSHSESPSSPPPRSASASPPKLSLQDFSPTSPGRINSYSRHSRETYTSARSPKPDGDALRTRLHDLLRDTPTSSSLPNMTSSYFPNTADRESSNTGNSPSSGGLNSAKATHNPSDSFSHLLASSLQNANKAAPAPSPIPFVGQRYSSASTEAKKLEEERRRKHLEEKQQRREERYKAERQRDDKTSTREERHREGHEKPKDERYGVDNERPHSNPDREYSAKPPLSATGARWDQAPNPYIYGPSNVSPSRRGSNAGHPYSQHPGISSTPVPEREHLSSQHGRYTPALSGGHKSRPVPIPNNPSHIYS